MNRLEGKPSVRRLKTAAAVSGADGEVSYLTRLKKDLRKNYAAYLLFLPVIVYYIIFAYKPMYGLIIAFKNYTPARGILASPWADMFGLRHFIDFFGSYYFGRLIRNTLVISVTSLVVTFPAPIILALLLNEVAHEPFKRTVQTLSYLPHFISLVVICGMIQLFVDGNGFITQAMATMGLASKGTSLLSHPQMFVPIYVISGLWQTIGWDAIIYISALSGVDQELYEAATMDGASRWKQTIHVTIPGIMSTIIVMFILRMGTVMSVGYEKIILLYNPGIYDTADVISSFVYRKGLLEANWSFSAAVGMFNSIINLVLVLVSNRISKKVTDMGLW